MGASGPNCNFGCCKWSMPVSLAISWMYCVTQREKNNPWFSTLHSQFFLLYAHRNVGKRGVACSKCLTLLKHLGTGAIFRCIYAFSVLMNSWESALFLSCVFAIVSLGPIFMRFCLVLQVAIFLVTYSFARKLFQASYGFLQNLLEGFISPFIRVDWIRLLYLM